MKYLIIDKGKGYFINSRDTKEEIDKITKEDILRLLDIATDKDQEFEMDEPPEDSNSFNQAHIIIYSHLYKKFNEILQDRDRFLDESTAIYKDALAKYGEEKSDT